MTGRGARFDPRLYQITILSLLLAYGALALDFEITALQAITIGSTALAAQWACSALWRLPRFDPLSATISALSLCLLLRTTDLWIDAAAAVLAVSSKFVVRIRGKHVFNPTNIAIVVLIALSDRAWVSPGQWGSGVVFAFFSACLGGLVVNRAARSDVTVAFAATYIALLVARSIWLGEPLTIPLHRLENGALVIFTFFMISDPKTTPDSRVARLAFAALVATGAYYVQFRLFHTNALLWSLACAAPLVPILDRLLPGHAYRWRSTPAETRPLNQSLGDGSPASGGSYEPVASLGTAPRPGLVVR